LLDDIEWPGLFRAGEVFGRTSLLRNRQCWEGYPKEGMNDCPKDVIKKKNAGY